jgi:hypothetical protein
LVASWLSIPKREDVAHCEGLEAALAF